MVNWLAGKRIRGTSSERTSGSWSSLNGVGGWVELGRHTLGSAADVISVTGLANKRYYMFLTNEIPTGGTTQPRWRTGNGSFDIGSNYAQRYQRNGGADGIGTSDSSVFFYDVNGSPTFGVGYLSNYATKEKIGINHTVIQNTSGAGIAPLRQEDAFKWANTSNSIDRISINKLYGTGTFASGSEVVVLGWDPADTHTNNFWQELASVELGSASTTFSSGTFTAKKYLWVQGYISGKSSSSDTHLKVGNGTTDTGTSYSERSSYNGATDNGVTSLDRLYVTGPNTTHPQFFNIFIINNASNEKLMICHVVRSTAGVSNAPDRSEQVFKWANTSSQINILDVSAGGGTINAGSIIKVWGSD